MAPPVVPVWVSALRCASTCPRGHAAFGGYPARPVIQPDIVALSRYERALLLTGQDFTPLAGAARTSMGKTTRVAADYVVNYPKEARLQER